MPPLLTARGRAANTNLGKNPRMIFRLFASAYSVAEIDRASSTNAATIAAFLPGERHDEVGEQCARVAVRVRGDKSPMRPETAKQFRALGECYDSNLPV